MNKKINNILGKRLKKSRQVQGLTQSKLAEGICTQAQVSNIEKGSSNDNPSSHTLFLLSERLGVSMSYLYGQDKYSFNRVKDEFDDVKTIIENAKTRRDYLTLKYIVNKEIMHNLDLPEMAYQYLLWHKAVYIYYLERNFQNAKNILSDALLMKITETNIESQLQLINIKLSYGIILTDENCYEDAEKILMECLSQYNELNEEFRNGEIDINLFNKIVFNISVYYTKRNKHQESLEHCLNAIEQSLQYNYMGLLGDLFFQAGYNYYHLDNTKQGRTYINHSLEIFKIQSNDRMIKIVIEYIKELYTTEYKGDKINI